MKTYEEMLAVSEAELPQFCVDAINAFVGSKEYKDAKVAEAYYRKENVTIEKFKKWLYTLSGGRIEDIFSANYKIKTLFFRRLVTQQVQYVLGNGVNLDQKNKEKLGKDFDFQLQKAAKKAMVQSRAFGFWNYDHMEVFGFCDTDNDAGFCPVPSEETGEIMAGLRFWSKFVNSNQIMRFTLYEIDGYTDFVRNAKEGTITILHPKRAYKITKIMTEADGIEAEIGENYTRLPIVPLYANDDHESELKGMRESIDAYDLIKSGLMNEIDDASGFYWIMKNSLGMEDADIAQFMQRIKTVRAAVVEGDSTIEAKTIDIPVEARKTALEILRQDIYEDFQALDVKTLSAAAKTTQEIRAAYQSQDDKCAEFEYLITDFVQRILEIAQIDDNPTFTWNKVVNMSEDTQMVLNSANYLTEDAIVMHLPFLTPEEKAEIIKARQNESLERFNEEPEEDEEEGEEE